MTHCCQNSNLVLSLSKIYIKTFFHLRELPIKIIEKVKTN